MSKHGSSASKTQNVFSFPGPSTSPLKVCISLHCYSGVVLELKCRSQILVFSWETFIWCACVKGQILWHQYNDSLRIGVANTTSHVWRSTMGSFHKSPKIANPGTNATAAFLEKFVHECGMLPGLSSPWPSTQSSLYALCPRPVWCTRHSLHTNSCCREHSCLLLMSTYFQWWGFMSFSCSEIFCLFAFWNLSWRIVASSHTACVLSRCDQSLMSFFHARLWNCDLWIIFLKHRWDCAFLPKDIFWNCCLSKESFYLKQQHYVMGGKKKQKDTSTKFHLLFSFSKVISLHLVAVIWWLSLAGGEKAKHLSSHCCLPSHPCAPNVVGVSWVTSLVVTFCSFCLPSLFLFTVAHHYDFLPNTL